MTAVEVEAPPAYAGIATRALGLATDALITQVIIFSGGAVFALIGSLVGGDVHFGPIARALAAVAWVFVTGSYFVFFWTAAGRTPGMHLLGLRVLAPDGAHPGLWRSTVRVVGLGLAIIPLFAGFLPVLFDDRRRALQDYMARTIVVYDTSPQL